jgi:heme exporter protein D
MNNYESVHNPFGLGKGVYEDLVWPAGAIGLVVLLISWVASVISLHLRLDGARGAEREQIQ